ncbi:endonuclease [Haloarcula hispanica tailed virus 2]|uniref:SNase-like protein n=1 Tax=Haloarcula hispanica tailed virus 2 TaxID=1273751 RepID=R4TG46_9CAUD|nr:endonuclease [Haloarcula hispanica tailed virus 2]AGM11201.1 SNase-like protein [Haloarcula hispanica tailed virus 2]
MTEPWVFPRARVERVVDGDTLDLIFDLGFRTYVHQRVRLRDVDTNEVYGVSHDSEEYEKGVEQSKFVKNWVFEAESAGELWPFTVETRKRGKYGRYLADVTRHSDGEDLAEALKARFEGL